MKQSVIIILLLSFFSCKGSDGADNKLVSSDEFRSVALYVEYSDNSPFSLDSIRTYFGNQDVSIVTDFQSEEFESFQRSGIYPVIDDRLARLYDKLTQLKYPYLLKLKVVGYKNGNPVFENEISAIRDNHHVQVDEKDLRISIPI